MKKHKQINSMFDDQLRDQLYWQLYSQLSELKVEDVKYLMSK